MLGDIYMSFFSKILKGLGFEDEEESVQKPKKQQKQKVKKAKLNSDFATFDLKQEQKNIEVENIEPTQPEPIQEQKNIAINSGSLEIIKIENQVQVQQVIDKVKNGEQVIVNMSSLSSADLARSLDFLTGALYALQKSMQKIDEAIFVIRA